MRVAVMLTATIVLFAGCKKTSTVTAPATTDLLSVTGAWTGCLVQPPTTCVPVSMTLSDTTLADSTVKVTGTGNWGSNVTIHGTLVNANLTLNATATGVIDGWSYSAIVSGSSLAGTMTLPGNPTAYQATFTLTP